MEPTADRLAAPAVPNRTNTSRATNATAVANDGALDIRRDREDDTVAVDGDHAHGNRALDRVSVTEAARLLGRDRTRIYALLRSGDLVAASLAEDDGESGPMRIERSSLERWLVAGGGRGGPLAPLNAWALIGLASGDQSFSERCLGLLERPEEVSRTRARLAREGLIDAAPRLRRRATVVVRNLPRALRQMLEHDATLVRTGSSAAAA